MTLPMKIAALTQGLNIPSARFRIRQLVDPLAHHGITLEELPAIPDAYPPAGGLPRLAWISSTFMNTLKRTIRSRNYDVCILQRELISTLPTLEAFVGKPMIADIDDAIWLYRGGVAAHYLAKQAHHLVAGNAHIAEHFANLGCQVTIIPTGVDTDRFHPLKPLVKRDYGVIGWSGTAGGYAYFEPLEAALGELLDRNRNWRLRFISDRAPRFTRLPAAQVEYRPWSIEEEAALTADMDIGLMPLDNSPWSLGKCSYKMLLYMACEIPVLASDVGMNTEILRMGEVGLGAQSNEDWISGLEALMQDTTLRRRLGETGRQLVKECFSLDVVTSQWLQLIQGLV